VRRTYQVWERGTGGATIREGSGGAEGDGVWEHPPQTILSVPRPLLEKRATGQELAPASAIAADRLLWRRRARPSATLDKMRTEL
jgi:hypothetical protein